MTWPDDEDSDISEECKDLIDKLLEPNPEERLGHRGAGEVGASLHAHLALITTWACSRHRQADDYPSSAFAAKSMKYDHLRRHSFYNVIIGEAAPLLPSK